MTKKKRREVSPEQRKRITLALMEPGCDVDTVAKKYNLARSTLLRYRYDSGLKNQDKILQILFRIVMLHF